MTAFQTAVSLYMIVTAFVFLGFVFFDKYGEFQVVEYEFAMLRELATKYGLFLFMALFWPLWIFSVRGKVGRGKNKK